MGGPANGLKYLADSNLDWGQDLRSLKEWARANRVDFLNVSYFGGDTPWRYFTDKEARQLPPPWSDAHTNGRTELPAGPGVYAISASVLPGQYFAPKYRDYYRQFRDRLPTARAGWSIYIYDLRGGP
ncbi:MAG: hypothetical protein FJW30_29925 [Acidobacteria bacterium]|nr:hypothetical protein [Acidobacteriota bacterium]